MANDSAKVRTQLDNTLLAVARLHQDVRSISKRLEDAQSIILGLCDAKRETDDLVCSLAQQDPAIVGMVDEVWNTWFNSNAGHINIPGVTRPRIQRTNQHLFTNAHDLLRARASLSGIRKDKKKDRKGKRRCTPPPKDTVFIDISENEADKETD
ncbi:hypothetical protein PsYK624_172300 [Phanerochaete sordida]|uniref:Uncharacterized protein n=1 Tax=Phanerochaete sordida TaxID=48140 RepID=A0A9P3GS81_9APHY|nr:hypothetical protein PsYK624_172300 [Phanerochaete sordida]